MTWWGWTLVAILGFLVVSGSRKRRTGQSIGEWLASGDGAERAGEWVVYAMILAVIGTGVWALVVSLT